MTKERKMNRKKGEKWKGERKKNEKEKRRNELQTNENNASAKLWGKTNLVKCAGSGMLFQYLCSLVPWLVRSPDPFLHWIGIGPVQTWSRRGSQSYPRTWVRKKSPLALVEAAGDQLKIEAQSWEQWDLNKKGLKFKHCSQKTFWAFWAFCGIF